MTNSSALPLAGITVLDFGHTVMGPCAGMILADLGADVIKIEPAPNGDPTRYLKGFGTGYFGYFNRNKRSIAINLKSAAGLRVAEDLIRHADVLIENFGPGTIERLGLGHERARAINSKLIFASLKGFLPGPYERRLALDEVVQMMAGLAYMTGPSGRPLRAGTSIVDITGAMFAVIGILIALRDRERTGNGCHVQSALFESTVFLMGQHLCYAALNDGPIPPMAERVSAWAVYEPFELKDGRQFFVGITTDNHWQRFCEVFDRSDLLGDIAFATNNDRIAQRGKLIPILREIFAELDQERAVQLCEQARIPFSPIARPEDLFADRHLEETGGLLPTTLPDGTATKLPRLPIMIGDQALELMRNPPIVGEHATEILRLIGRNDEEIGELVRSEIVTSAQTRGDPAVRATE